MQQESSNIWESIQKRDKSVDVLKGLAMILIVTGHAFTPHRDWIYLFHVAVFFTASGYCWHSKIQSGKQWSNYVWRKIKELYFPYIIYNCLFVFLNNLFVNLNIYTNNPYFLEATIGINDIYPQSLTSIVSFNEMLEMLIKVCIFLYRPQVGGATWFITSLLVILVAHATVE